MENLPSIPADIGSLSTGEIDQYRKGGISAVTREINGILYTLVPSKRDKKGGINLLYAAWYPKADIDRLMGISNLYP